MFGRGTPKNYGIRYDYGNNKPGFQNGNNVIIIEAKIIQITKIETFNYKRTPTQKRPLYDKFVKT